MIPILSVRNLSTGYGKKQVLFNVNLDVMPGEVLLIAGSNGSGKSTLLKAIYGLLSPWNSDAEIVFHPTPEGPLVGTNPSRNLRIGLAYLPQKNAVFENLTVEENLHLSGHTLSRQPFIDRCDEVLALFPTLKVLFHRKPERMSGGERQIVALAMILLHWPKLLLLDEPFAGLDAQHTQLLGNTIRQISQQRRCTILLTEHRLGDVSTWAHRIVHFRQGCVLPDNLQTESLPTEPFLEKSGSNHL